MAAKLLSAPTPTAISTLCLLSPRPSPRSRRRSPPPLRRLFAVCRPSARPSASPVQTPQKCGLVFLQWSGRWSTDGAAAAIRITQDQSLTLPLLLSSSRAAAIPSCTLAWARAAVWIAAVGVIVTKIAPPSVPLSSLQAHSLPRAH